MKTQQKSIKCICGSNEFSINLNKTESVGLVNCKKCEKNYFLLDSGDFWYDVIQEKYPSLTKCNKCKNSFFQIVLTYEFRQDSNNVKYIQIVGTCNKCNTSKNLGTWKIDYGPTDSLVRSPLVFVKNPKIKYNLSTKTCYWTPKDLVKFLEFLFEQDLSIYWQHFDNKQILTKKFKRDEAVKRASNLDYYKFIASQKELTIPKNQKINWKKEEVISVSSPIYMNLGGKIGEKIGLLFYIEYTSNYIANFTAGNVKEKSNRFKQFIKMVENWLKSNYQSLRGKNSFDNLKEHKRLFGDEFLKKRE